MVKNNEPMTVCTSIFKNGERTTTVKDFTDMWITLINTIEKSKSERLCKNE